MELILGQRDVQTYNNGVDLDPMHERGPRQHLRQRLHVSSTGTAVAAGTWVAGTPSDQYLQLVTVTVSLARRNARQANRSPFILSAMTRPSRRHLARRFHADRSRDNAHRLAVLATIGATS